MKVAKLTWTIIIAGSCTFWVPEHASPPHAAEDDYSQVDDFTVACADEMEDASAASPRPFLHCNKPARRSATAAASPIQGKARQQHNVTNEIGTRIAAVAKEDERKNREHLLRMRLQRAESRDKANKRRHIHDLEVENLKAKRALIELKIQIAKKKLE